MSPSDPPDLGDRKGTAAASPERAPARTPTASTEQLGDRTLAGVARLHYDHGMTHREIAESIGTSRVRVTRMLAEARRTGVVEITIHGDPSPFTELGQAVAERFGLSRVLVAPSVSEAARTRRSVATLAAHHLAEALGQTRLMTFGLSSTVGAAVDLLPDTPTSGLTLVPAAGGWAGPSTGLNPEELTSRIAALTGGASYNLLAPLLAPSADVATQIRSQPMVRSGLERAARADTLVTGVGGMVWSESALQVAVTEDERAELTALGAVGDTSGRFFDERGRPLDSWLDRRVIGLTLTELLAIPTRIVVAHGQAKLAALRGALVAGLPTHLITDHTSASALLAD